MQVNVTILDDASCASSYAAVIAVNTKKQFCAGKYRYLPILLDILKQCSGLIQKARHLIFCVAR